MSRGHTFIVRMHRTAPAAGVSDAWRGEVVHVPTQEAVSFMGLTNVADAITRLIVAVERPG